MGGMACLYNTHLAVDPVNHSWDKNSGNMAQAHSGSQGDFFKTGLPELSKPTSPTKLSKTDALGIFVQDELLFETGHPATDGVV